MKSARPVALTLTILSLAVAMFASTAQQPEPTTVAGAWSPVVKDVRGRLLATPDLKAGKPQVRLELELQNMSDGAVPIAIRWTNWNEMLTFALEEESGKAVVSDIAPGGNQFVIPPYWLQLPLQSMIRSTISNAAFEYLTSPDRLLLRPTVFQGWMLFPAQTWTPFLSATLKPPKASGQREPWVGPLKLPRVALPVIAYH